MVTFNNVGRMGNYLYEFACAFSFAKKYELEFTVPLNERDPKWCPIYFKHLRNGNYSINLKEVHLWENGHHYQPLEFKEEYRDCNIIIEGYRQSWKYFNEYRDEIIKVFNFQYEKNEGVCSIHVRRGDYMLNLTKHPVVTEEYLNEAIWYMIDFIDCYKFKFFSDEIEWCKQFVEKTPHKNIEFEFSEGKNEIQDLVAMSECEHQICSNSTMAVWAAELNQNPNKIVIVPSEDNWFGFANKHLEVYDMYRPEWVQIKY